MRAVPLVHTPRWPPPFSHSQVTFGHFGSFRAWLVLKPEMKATGNWFSNNRCVVVVSPPNTAIFPVTAIHVASVVNRMLCLKFGDDSLETKKN